MATVTESRTGRTKSLGAQGRQYVIKGVTSETEALVALLAGVPATLDGMKLDRSNCDVEEVAFTATEGVYIGHAKWISEDQTAGSFSISFDISGQTQRITQAVSTRSLNYLAGEPHRDFKGAINVQDGTVEGVDIIVPTFTFVLDYTVDPADINDAYIGTLRDLVGTMNASAFKGFGAGELLFTKVSGRKRDEEAWDLSFGFNVSKTKTAFAIGARAAIPAGGGNPAVPAVAGIAVAEKRGWDYLWVYYKQKYDAVTKVTNKEPVAVFVEQVYDDGNYTLLGLP